MQISCYCIFAMSELGVTGFRHLQGYKLKKNNGNVIFKLVDERFVAI